MTREEVRKKLIELNSKHERIMVELPTGFRKTAMAIMLLDKNLGNKRFLWVVPEITLIKGMKDEFKARGAEHLVLKGDFICYASLEKYKGSEYDYVILDESHHSFSDIRIGAIKEIKYRKLVALSATINDEIKKVLNDLGGWGSVKVTLEEAINAGELPKPTIHIIRTKLDNTIKRNKYNFEDKTSLLTDKEYYDALSKTIAYHKEIYEDEGIEYHKNLMFRIGSVRKAFLADCKEYKVKELVEDLGDERFICFCGSVPQAKRLGKNVCSSLTNKGTNGKLVDAYNEGLITNLFAKKMLQEGANLFDTQYGIIVQLENSERFLLQTLGRVLRSDNPVLYIFIVNDTIDESYLKNATINNKNLFQ